MRRGYHILEHPSDLGIEARGGTLAEAFCEAGKGLMSVIADSSAVSLPEKRIIHLTGSDVKHLLVQWLSEILYLYDGQQFVAQEFDIDTLTESELNGTVRGNFLSPELHLAKLDVKAVTYHQIAIENVAGGCVVRVYLDI